MLSISRLSKKIGSKNIIQDISLSVEKGEVVVLLGPNGSGKTTLLKTIIGLYQTPQEINSHNVVLFNEKPINNATIDQRVSSGLLYLPQHSSLFQNMSVQNNLDLVYEYHSYWTNKKYSEFLNERNKWLAYTSLERTLLQQSSVLSGGQKRKLEVVRALLMHPSIIMLDEPFAGVDPKSIYELKKIFQDMAKQNIGVLISDHHVDQLLSIATRGYVVVQGKIVTSGNIHNILNCPYTKERYLGTQLYNEISQKLQTEGSQTPKKKDAL